MTIAEIEHRIRELEAWLYWHPGQNWRVAEELQRLDEMLAEEDQERAVEENEIPERQ